MGKKRKSVELTGWSLDTAAGSRVFVAPHPDSDGCCIRFTDKYGANTDIGLSKGAADAFVTLWERCKAHHEAMRELWRHAVALAACHRAPAPAMWAGCPPQEPREVESFRCSEAVATMAEAPNSEGGTYVRTGPSDPMYAMVEANKASGSWVCDALDHNAVGGCPNPKCFKYEPPRADDHKEVLR